MAESRVRGAQPADLEALSSLLSSAGLPVQDLSEELVRNFLVVTTGETVVGCIGLEPLSNIGLLRSLVIDPGHRRGGLGRLLVGSLEADAMRRGINELWLLTIDADRYFGTLGYRGQAREQAPASIRRTAEFSLLCPDDAKLMKKSI